MNAKRKAIALLVSAPIAASALTVGVAGAAHAEPVQSAVAAKSAATQVHDSNIPSQEYAPGSIATITMSPDLHEGSTYANTNIAAPTGFTILKISASDSTGYTINGNSANVQFGPQLPDANPSITMTVQIPTDAQYSQTYQVGLKTVGTYPEDTPIGPVPMAYTNTGSATISTIGQPISGSFSIPGTSNVGDTVQATARFDHLPQYARQEFTVVLPAGLQLDTANQPALPNGITMSGVTVDESGVETVTYTEAQIEAIQGTPIAIPMNIDMVSMGTDSITSNVMISPTIGGSYETAYTADASITVMPTP